MGNISDSFFNLANISSVVTGQMLGPSSLIAAGSVHGASLGRPDIYRKKHPHDADVCTSYNAGIYIF